MNKGLLYILGAGAVLIALIYFTGGGSPAAGGYSSRDVEGLAAAKASETIELKDGDTYDLTASYVRKNINGREYKMLAYNGSIPGPLLKIPQGAEVTINFKNGTDMNTLLHSHGVRMDNRFDGSQSVQKEMKPGDSFSYKLAFPDAGFYWYHPHVREDYEQELGLYGGYLVTPRESGYWPEANREEVLFLDDILIENGEILLSQAGADRTLMGRFGNVMLINGEANYSLSLKQGEIVRFYAVNAANTRPFNLAISGAKLKLIGADGGAYESASWKESVILAPSERAVVEVLFDKSGTFALEHRTPGRIYKLGTISVGEARADISHAAAFGEFESHPAVLASIDPFRSLFDKAPTKELVLTLDMHMGGMGHGGHMMGGSGALEWEDTSGMMNQMSDTESIRWKLVDRATGRENMDIDWVFKKDEPVKIRITNDAHSMHPMQHPIHFHGQRFLVAARNGVLEKNLVWKDTVLVPSGETADIILDTSNPGEWMAHCHIAEHLEAGMMMAFRVE